MFDIHECSGGPESGGARHIQIHHTPRRQVFLNVSKDGRLSTSYFVQHNGDMTAYLDSFFSINKEAKSKPNGCWRVKNGISQCSGPRKDLTDIVISIPVIFTVEISSATSDNEDGRQWSAFPLTIFPLSDSDVARKHNIAYDLVGYAILTLNDTHFTCRYISGKEGKKQMYHYDGMKNAGFPTSLPADYDLNSDVPLGDSKYQAFYFLRGGLKAQEKFIELRSQELSKKYPLEFKNTDLSSPISITYTAKDLQLMDPKFRSWMIDPYRSETSEYISIAIPWIPPLPSQKIVESEDPGSESDKMAVQEQVLRNSPATSEVLSLPESLFSLNCRCGATGDGNVLYRKDDVGGAIQCNECKDWSHIACQREGRASDLPEDTGFICDFCDLSSNTVFSTLLYEEKIKLYVYQS